MAHTPNPQPEVRWRPRIAPALCFTAATLLTIPSVGQPADPPPNGDPAAPASPAQNESGGKDPQAVFALAQAAYNQRDWAGFVQTVSPGRRDELIGQFAATFAHLAHQPEADSRVVDLVQRHVPKDLNPMDLLVGSADPRKDLVHLARRMRDGEGFFAEAMSVAFAMEFGDQASEVKLVELASLAVGEAGDNAIGKVVLQTPDGEREDEWTFEKYEDAWYLSMK